MFKQISGEENVLPYTAPASTAFNRGDVVTNNGSGKLAKATATTVREEILGVIGQTIASTDADYASDKTVPVTTPSDEAEFEVDVTTGTLTSAMVGERYDLDDEAGIDVTAQTHKHVEITRFISGTVARVKLIVADSV